MTLELALQDAIGLADLLLLAQLQRITGWLAPTRGAVRLSVGRFTTEDEMFLFLAYYYCSPDFPDTCKNEYGFLGGGGPQ